MLGGLSEERFKQLARYLSYPRGIKIHDQESYNTYLRARRINQLMREVGKNNLDLLGMDLANVKNWYAANLSGNAGRYLKTSSLIVTYNDLLTTGGHNLSSRISRVNSMTNYKHTRNYTPTATTEPAPTTTKPSADKPAQKQSNTHKTRQSNNNSSNQTTKQSSNQKVRTRTSVISSAPRRTRGL